MQQTRVYEGVNEEKRERVCVCVVWCVCGVCVVCVCAVFDVKN